MQEACRHGTALFDPWRPEMSDASMRRFIHKHPVPDRNPGAVAFVLRGAVYRSANHSGTGSSHPCGTKESTSLQEMASASHVYNIIRPLEAQNITVDVFAAAFHANAPT